MAKSAEYMKSWRASRGGIRRKGVKITPTAPVANANEDNTLGRKGTDVVASVAMDSVNPNYDKGTRWQENCQRCVWAYEFQRRGYNVDIGVIEQRTKNNDKWEYKQLEVDFIANKGNNKIYIQSAFAMPDKEKREQEEAPLLKIFFFANNDINTF